MARVKLTPAQKDEIRKLTQFANRRIRKVQKTYAKEGALVMPRELTGSAQIQENWATSNTPISRSVVFESERDYRQQITFLRRFRNMNPTLEDFTQRHAERTTQSIETALGSELTPELREKISNMTAPQIDRFWNNFTQKSIRLGALYNSESAAAAALQEIFNEDMTHLLQSSIGG